MGDRFFVNEFPDLVAEREEEESGQQAAADSSSSSSSSSSSHQATVTKLLALPYHRTAERFLRRALDLKDKIVNESWVRAGERVKDFTLYTGSLGTAYLLFKAYQVTNNKNDLNLCIQILRACDYASRDSRHVTFICGRAGVCALGAVAAKQAGDQALLKQYLTQFKKIRLPEGIPNELLYGRSGYLWACFFLNKYIGERTIPSSQTGVISKRIITDGIRLSNSSSCPLMYEWHGKKYWGAAHGLAGIMRVLMELELEPDKLELVKGTLRYMIHNRFPSGNYPSSEDSETDRLVHWCHGAPGIALTLTKAAKVFQDEEFLKAAGDAQEVVWNRGLLKRVGICHGVSGNAYVFLALYQLTGNIEFLYRAKAFACFLLDRADSLIMEGKMHGGDRPYSLFEGSGGMAFLFFDMIHPNEARFPGYEL